MAVISRHSDRAAARPRRRKCRNPRLCLICPNLGSIDRARYRQSSWPVSVVYVYALGHLGPARRARAGDVELVPRARRRVQPLRALVLPQARGARRHLEATRSAARQRSPLGTCDNARRGGSLDETAAPRRRRPREVAASHTDSPPHAAGGRQREPTSAATVRAGVGIRGVRTFLAVTGAIRTSDHADPPHPRQHEGRAKFRLRPETRNSPGARRSRRPTLTRRCICRGAPGRLEGRRC